MKDAEGQMVAVGDVFIVHEDRLHRDFWSLAE